MDKYKGKVASHGYAYGTIVEISHKNTFISKKKVNDTNVEITKFDKALVKAIKELEELYEKALVEVGEDNAQIFFMHKMLLEDPDYRGNIVSLIVNNNFRAEYAVDIIGKQFANTFSAMEDEYMSGRAADFRDITKRVIKIIQNKKQVSNSLPKNCIIVTDDLDPSETIHLDKKKVIAFITRRGSINSHTAILARTMNIPALVSVKIPYGVNGNSAIVDTVEAKITVSPDCERVSLYDIDSKKHFEKMKLLEDLKGVDVKTKSNKYIKLRANIGNVSDVEYAVENDADGIGLFRTEFLYLESNDFPTEEQQLMEYKKVAQLMGDKVVVIRTLDFGADKQAEYFELHQEENPALGYRAIRICLTKEDLFKTQLRAIYRASMFGNIKIMFPMVIAEWEIVKTKEFLKEVQEELTSKGIEFKNVEIGLTIETPAAVMIADELAKHVDFFSIGTNDLTQYSLAIDRQNQKLERFYDPHHPAIFKMIEMVVSSAKRNNISVSICGELGADIAVTKRLIGLGVDELSVAPSMILPVKKEILDCE